MVVSSRLQMASVDGCRQTAIVNGRLQTNTIDGRSQNDHFLWTLTNDRSQ